jgi:Cu/Ag efflux protein CusF
MRHRMALNLAMLVGIAMLVASSVGAQQPPPSPQQPMTAPRSAPAPEISKEQQIEGTVSKVDALGKTVGVSTGFFGFLGRTLQVDDGTQIRVQGQPASLTEIKEGAKVKASYEVRDGKNVARMIDVTAEKVESATPSRAAAGAKPGSTPTQ